MTDQQARRLADLATEWNEATYPVPFGNAIASGILYAVEYLRTGYLARPLQLIDGCTEPSKEPR